LIKLKGQLTKIDVLLECPFVCGSQWELFEQTYLGDFDGFISSTEACYNPVAVLLVSYLRPFTYPHPANVSREYPCIRQDPSLPCLSYFVFFAVVSSQSRQEGELAQGHCLVDAFRGGLVWGF